ncbi:MAG: methylglyoxal synthase [Bacteroidales bacterium]
MKKIKKNIALVAHDNRKKELLEWVNWNRVILARHHLFCTGTTGKFIQKALVDPNEDQNSPRLSLTILKSGPLGGDQQMGALIVEGKIDMMIFFWDPMQPQPHDVDVKALLRITVLYNLPTASNRSTADFLISSDLFETKYTPKPLNFDEYLNRAIEIK